MRKLFLEVFFLLCIAIIAVAQPPAADSGKNKVIAPPYTEKDLPRLKYGIDTAVKSANWEAASSLSNITAAVYYRQFRYEEAEKYSLQAINFARKSGNAKKQVVEIYNLGYTHYKKFDYSLATEYFLQALRLAKEISYPNMEVLINNALGQVYKYLEDYDRALQYFLPAYRTAQQFSGDTAYNLLSNLLINIGNCEDRRGNYRQGILYYNKYLALRPDDRYTKVLAYNNIALTLLKLNEIDSAEALFIKAYNTEDTIRNPAGRSYSNHGFSLIAFAKKEYQKAIALATKAKAGAKRYRIKNLEWLCDKILADCYQQTDDYKLANENLAAYTAIRDSIFLRQRIDRVGVLDASYRFELETGRKQQQIDLLNKENSVKALELENLQVQNRIGQLQLSNLNKERVLAQLQLSNLSNEKKLSVLQLSNLRQKDSLNGLKLENYNRTTAETNIRMQSLNQQVRLNQLQLSLQRRSQLLMGAGIGLLLLGFLFFYRTYRHKKLSELEKIRSNIAADFHDDLGSTLSSIALHSEVALRAGQTAPAQMQKTLSQISEASRSTVSAMQDMIWSIQPQHDTMEQTVFRMQEWAIPLAEAKDIQIDFQVEEAVKALRPVMELRKNIYLIFKEALNNAFKYANATQIQISLTRTGQLLQLDISDNGKGFDLVAQAAKGNGLRNMNRRAEQAGGRLRLTTAPGKGTRLQYQCPHWKKIKNRNA